MNKQDESLTFSVPKTPYEQTVQTLEQAKEDTPHPLCSYKLLNKQIESLTFSVPETSYEQTQQTFKQT